MSLKRWKLKNTVIDEGSVAELANMLNVQNDPATYFLISKLLHQRNITNFESARKFFKPSLDELYDPYLMDQMDVAVERIKTAIAKEEKIVIYGDYDVDGTCATSILYMYLKELKANVDFFIPKRLIEGYGISVAAIEKVIEKKPNLIISVDCGITAFDEVEFVKSNGIDIIITDHHHPKETIPNALAVLNPLKENCKYPFKHLSGAGVALKLIQALAQSNNDFTAHLKYLDLVALSIAADIVLLLDENRTLFIEGLRKINTTPRPGVRALICSSRLKDGQVNSRDILFVIAPRINAVGRLGDAEEAVKLLTDDDFKKALIYAERLEADNTSRKKIDDETFKVAQNLVNADPNLNDDIPIVLHNEEWHPGVIGIVASKLVEKYYRPAIMLTTVDGIAKGSARSISSLNIFDALKECEDLLLHYGGHQAAAGLALQVENIEEFRIKLNKVLKNSLHSEKLMPEILIDQDIKFTDITSRFFRILEKFSPFGPGNPQPVFVSRRVKSIGFARTCGFEYKHLMCKLAQDGCNQSFDAIGFGLGDYCNILNKEKPYFDIVYKLDYNSYNAYNNPVKINIQDIKIIEDKKIEFEEKNELKELI